MELKTFEALLMTAKTLYDNATAHDRKLQSAFGGDTQIITEWWSETIEDIVAALSVAMNDDNEMVDWLFWESMCSIDGYMDFDIEKVTYEGTPENVWKYLNDELISDLTK